MTQPAVNTNLEAPGTGNQDKVREQLRRRRQIEAIQIFTIRLLFILGLFGLWEYGSGRWFDTFIFSKPSDIWVRTIEMIVSGELWRHVRATFVEIGIGYPVGSILGLATGYIFGRYRFLAKTFEPIIVALYGIPRTAIAPIFIIALGVGIESKVAIVILMTFFLTFFNTYSGMRQVDHEFINLARLMGANETTVTFRIILPYISPYVMVGLKTSVPQSVIGATVGEFIASYEGLGYLIKQAASLFDPATLFVAVIVLLVVVLVGNNLLDRIERWAMRWKPPTELHTDS